jgi:hypothetical protein
LELIFLTSAQWQASLASPANNSMFYVKKELRQLNHDFQTSKKAGAFAARRATERILLHMLHSVELCF